MTTDKERDLAEASGESAYRAPRSLELNEVSLNGDADVHDIGGGKLERKGGFFRKRILAGRTKRDEKPEEVNLGTSINVVFLKIAASSSSGARRGRSSAPPPSTTGPRMP